MYYKFREILKDAERKRPRMPVMEVANGTEKLDPYGIPLTRETPEPERPVILPDDFVRLMHETTEHLIATEASIDTVQAKLLGMQSNFQKFDEQPEIHVNELPNP